jgi:hypothetical protein
MTNPHQHRPQNKCGPGQPPEPHRSWISRLAFSLLGTARRRYWSDSAPRECHFYQCWLSAVIRRIKSAQPLRWPAAQPVQRAGEEAAMPGQPARTRARFRMSPGNSPSRIASCHRRHRNHRSASRKSSHVFAEFTLRQNVACRNGKTFRACAEAVDDESSLWKTEEICGTIGEEQSPRHIARK